MIVTTLEQVQKYLPSFNLKVKVDRIRDFLDRAQQWMVEHVIGDDIEELLEIDIEEGAPDPHERLRTLASRAICAKAYIDLVAEMDLQLSEAGFVVQNNGQMSPASQQRTANLVQSLHNRLCADADSLVKLLLKDAAYDDWHCTDQFAYLTEAFMPTTAIVRQNAPTAMQIANWQDFYDMVPRMVEALRGPVASYISTDEIDRLLEMYRDQDLLEVHRKALRWVRMAVMAHVTDASNADRFAIEARQWMLKHGSSFPEFVGSDRYELPEPFSFGEGTVANAL